jgi:hypothetical protein
VLPRRGRAPMSGNRATLAVAAFVIVLGGASPRARAGDPTTLDCLTANESALTLRNQHALRAARAQLLMCSAASCPADVRNECIRRVGEVNEAMPTIVLEAKDASGHSLIAVTVKMDDELLAPRLEGTALSIDPGPHTFTFAVAGQAPIEKPLLILEGEKDRRERVVFESVGKPEPARTLDASDLAASPLTGGGPSRLGVQRTVGLALASAGVVALGVGATYALVAISRRDTASAACPDRCTDPSGVDLWNRARSAGDVATIAFVAGGAAVVGGVAVWLLARPRAEPPPRAQLGFGPHSVGVLGQW